ncbi:hypothetical protein L1049_009041 [Liquidambar formosana]|uniref:Uncharacterized protein n=1 Tax=Liquidambar formosana TaxID=63359 RepID=A0AAP0S789_LIQFO
MRRGRIPHLHRKTILFKEIQLDKSKQTLKIRQADYKRGFSNAQASGGHMNIHRKDKAMLKQTSTYQAQQSLDIPKTAPSYFPIWTNRLQSSEIKFGEERGTIKRPWILKI